MFSIDDLARSTTRSSTALARQEKRPFFFWCHTDRAYVSQTGTTQMLCLLLLAPLACAANAALNRTDARTSVMTTAAPPAYTSTQPRNSNTTNLTATTVTTATAAGNSTASNSTASNSSASVTPWPATTRVPTIACGGDEYRVGEHPGVCMACAAFTCDVNTRRSGECLTGERFRHLLFVGFQRTLLY